MAQSADNNYDEALILLQREIPDIEPITAEEIERRRLIVERILRRRERVGPIGINADDLLHAARNEPVE